MCAEILRISNPGLTHGEVSREPEYVFHHPVIRAVAYESQLKSDRARLHRGLAALIEAQDSTLADESAALIAGHLEAAGDLHAAYGWHMRAATWATNRDIAAARLSWERAQSIADALPTEDVNRTSMRIAPRTMLCGTAWRVHTHVAGARFDELRQLCALVGDKPSLAIAMAGLVMDHAHQGRMREASPLASEAWALAESVGDATLTVGLSLPLITARLKVSRGVTCCSVLACCNAASCGWILITRPRWDFVQSARSGQDHARAFGGCITAARSIVR
jgi:hypothetical protein